MDLQTILLWVARLACPLALGLIVWWFLRQSGDAPEPSPSQRLSRLHQRREALEAEIVVLEARAHESTPAQAAQTIEPETTTV